MNVWVDSRVDGVKVIQDSGVGKVDGLVEVCDSGEGFVCAWWHSWENAGVGWRSGGEGLVGEPAFIIQLDVQGCL